MRNNNAVMLANLKVTERHAHSYISSYVPIGRDATVSWGSLDFKFKNFSEVVGNIYEINNLIKKVSDDIENLKLNTAIAAFMTFIKKIKEDGFITKEELRIFLILLNPLAPHITSEMYEMIFGGNITERIGVLQGIIDEHCAKA